MYSRSNEYYTFVRLSPLPVFTFCEHDPFFFCACAITSKWKRKRDRRKKRRRRNNVRTHEGSSNALFFFIPELFSLFSTSRTTTIAGLSSILSLLSRQTTATWYHSCSSCQIHWWSLLEIFRGWREDNRKYSTLVSGESKFDFLSLPRNFIPHENLLHRNV